jgi:mono/diheme cytochrome c family protein
VARILPIWGLALVAAALPACSKSANTQAASSSAPSSAAGASMYLATCASCHQPDGKGMGSTFPPLAGNALVTGDPAKVIRVVKYGLTGPTVVAGKTYNGMMPAWSPQLTDANIALTVTYIRASWGNHASAVTAPQVRAVSR